MNHLERIASIVGTLLIGISAYLIASDRAVRESRRIPGKPIEKLEADLRNAWAGYHNR